MFLIPTFLFAPSLSFFIPGLVLGELCLFMSQSPASAVMLWAVPKRLRPFAMSLNTITIHVLGDVPSPPILGMLQTRLANWRYSISMMTVLLCVASGFFFLGAVVAKGRLSYQNEGEEEQLREVEGEGQEPEADNEDDIF